MITFSIVMLTIAPCLIKAWRDPQRRMITRWIAYAYTCGFMFGWHVHEKASLHFVIPLAIIALKSVEDAKHYFYLSIGNSLSYSLVMVDLSKSFGRHDFVLQRDLCDSLLQSKFTDKFMFISIC